MDRCDRAAKLILLPHRRLQSICSVLPLTMKRRNRKPLQSLMPWTGKVMRGVEDSVTRHSLRPALNVLAILRNKPAFHLKSARGVFAAAKALDITLPLSCIRRPTGD